MQKLTKIIYQNIVARFFLMFAIGLAIVSLVTPLGIYDAEEFCLYQSAAGGAWYISGLGRPAHFLIIKLCALLSSNPNQLIQYFGWSSLIAICLTIAILCEIFYRHSKSLGLSAVFILLCSANPFTNNFAYSLYSESFAFLFLALAAFTDSRSRMFFYFLVSILFKEVFIILCIGLLFAKKIRPRLIEGLILLSAVLAPAFLHSFANQLEPIPFLRSTIDTQLNPGAWFHTLQLRRENFVYDVWPVIFGQILIWLCAYSLGTSQQRKILNAILAPSAFLFLILPYGAESDFRNLFPFAVLTAVSAVFVLTSAKRKAKWLAFSAIAIHFISFSIFGFSQGRLNPKKLARQNQIREIASLANQDSGSYILEPELAYRCQLSELLQNPKNSMVIRIPATDSSWIDFKNIIDQLLHENHKVLFLDLGTSTKQKLMSDFELHPINQKIFVLGRKNI